MKDKNLQLRMKHVDDSKLYKHALRLEVLSKSVTVSAVALNGVPGLCVCLRSEAITGDCGYVTETW